ncbi:MAG: hypothetical protein ACRDWI_11790 [Jiangellaceae bacterium]
MENLIYLLPVLACPVGMGVMMWMMMRPGRGQTTTPTAPTAAEQELAQLKNEVDALRTRLHADTADDTRQTAR